MKIKNGKNEKYIKGQKSRIKKTHISRKLKLHNLIIKKDKIFNFLII